MNKRLLLWGVPSVMWLLFTVWYTDFGGPLSDEEVNKAMAYFDTRGVPPERRRQLQAFFENDSGRQFLMVNNIQMNPNPPPMPGFDAGATSEDYQAHYMEHMYPELLFRACHPVFYASGLGFAADVSGIEDAEGWDTAALFRYRSRRSFLEIITNPEIGPRHDFKLAAMTKTIAYPVETSLYLSDPRLLLFLLFGLVTAMIDIFVYGRGKSNQ
ncbi:MAG: hypothetical protein V7708_12765 [Oceanicoccus sp.]